MKYYFYTKRKLSWIYIYTSTYKDYIYINVYLVAIRTYSLYEQPPEQQVDDLEGHTHRCVICQR